MSSDKDPEPHRLPLDWPDCAEATARNLGFTAPLQQLPPEHWQKVLIGVEMKMRLKGSVLPEGWQTLLAHEVGRLSE